LVDLGSSLLALTLNGELTVLEPDDDEFVELGKFKVASTEAWAHPVVAGTRIFVRDAESVSLWNLE